MKTKNISILFMLALIFGTLWILRPNSKPHEPSFSAQNPDPTPQAPTLSLAERKPDAQKTSPTKISGLEEFKKKYAGEWIADETDGHVRMLGGGALAGRGQSAPLRQDFVREMENWLGVSAQQLTPESESHARSELTEAFNFNHQLNGVPVYNSQVKLVVRRDGAVIMMTSTLKPITEVISGSHLSRTEILERFVEERQRNVLALGATELLWARDDGKAEPAWQIEYRKVKTNEARSAIVSAVDGHELADESSQSH